MLHHLSHAVSSAHTKTTMCAFQHNSVYSMYCLRVKVVVVLHEVVGQLV